MNKVSGAALIAMGFSLFLETIILVFHCGLPDNDLVSYVLPSCVIVIGILTMMVGYNLFKQKCQRS